MTGRLPYLYSLLTQGSLLTDSIASGYALVRHENEHAQKKAGCQVPNKKVKPTANYLLSN